MKHSFKVGDNVAMSSKWLKSMQSHEWGHVRGQVYHVGDMVIAVEWDNGHISGVLASNLVLVNRMHLEAV